jgi:ferrochelatase
MKRYEQAADIPESMRRKAVILLAYGGPDKLEDIPAYLDDIRGGRPTARVFIDDITERYRLIGGRSPLLEITCKTAAKLQEKAGLPVYVGMRHWAPRIQEVVFQMALVGVDHLAAICMAPHYSALSIAKYREKLEEAIAATGRPMAVDFISSWHLQPHYLQGLTNDISMALGRWSEDRRDSVTVIFTAHSLPAYILDNGDPYDRQLHETAEAVAQELGLPTDRWLFSYQSAAKTGVPWLGPQIEEVVVDLAREGCKDLLIAPIGFIADHVEVLYDIDIRVQEIAQVEGVRLERSAMLNDSDMLVSALASIVEMSDQRTGGWGQPN